MYPSEDVVGQQETAGHEVAGHPAEEHER
jgi:hypothetical protein